MIIYRKKCSYIAKKTVSGIKLYVSGTTLLNRDLVVLATLSL